MTTHTGPSYPGPEDPMSPTTKPPRHVVSATLTPDEYATLSAAAAASGERVSSHAATLLRHALGAPGPQPFAGLVAAWRERTGSDAAAEVVYEPRDGRWYLLLGPAPGQLQALPERAAWMTARVRAYPADRVQAWLDRPAQTPWGRVRPFDLDHTGDRAGGILATALRLYALPGRWLAVDGDGRPIVSPDQRIVVDAVLGREDEPDQHVAWDEALRRR